MGPNRNGPIAHSYAGLPPIVAAEIALSQTQDCRATNAEKTQSLLGNIMATSQPTTNCLYIKYKNFANGYHFFTVVGHPEVIAVYQASLVKPFYDKDGVTSLYCTKDPEAALIQSGRLVQWKRGDGTIGFVHDLDQFRTLRDLAAKQPASLVEFFMKQAITAANCEIPQQLSQESTPQVLEPEAFNPPLDQQ